MLRTMPREMRRWMCFRAADSWEWARPRWRQACYQRPPARSRRQKKIRNPTRPRTIESASAPGPGNPALDAQNPDSFLPPPTDAGGVQTFKYPFGIAHKRMQEGGWSREVTVRELAGFQVDRRRRHATDRRRRTRAALAHRRRVGLHAVRKRPDHRARCRRQELRERREQKAISGTFPRGFHIPFKGLNPDGAEFLLVFDDGNFSEYETVLLTDWMAHTPHDVLSKNFGVSEQALEKMPRREKFIFQAAVPGPLADDQKATAGTLGLSPQDFAFRTAQQPVTKHTKGGEVRIVDSSKFKVSTTIAAAIVTVHPGGIRELHWHPNADEWQYYISRYRDE